MNAFTSSMTRILKPIRIGRQKSELQVPVVEKSGSPLAQWIENRRQIMEVIFKQQGYFRPATGRAIKGARHVVIPVSPSIEDAAKYHNLSARLLNLADNFGKAARCKTYAEWAMDNSWIYYFFRLKHEYWQPFKLSDMPAGVVGRTEYGQSVAFDFDDAYNSALITGAPGAGKSIGSEAVIISQHQRFTPDKMGMIILDSHDFLGGRKSGSVGTFERLDNLIFGRVAKTVGEISHDIRWAYSELKRRKVAPRDAMFRDIVIVIDEASSIEVMGLAEHRRGKDHRDRLVQNVTMLTAIAAEGRKRGMHLVVCTQFIDHLDSSLFNLLTYRFVGLFADNQVGTRNLGIPGLKAVDLTGGGDFFVARDTVSRFLFALPDRTDFDKLRRGDPVMIEQPEPAEVGCIDDVSLESLLDSGNNRAPVGRPAMTVDHLKLLIYLKYGPQAISKADAKEIELLQLSESMHRRYKDWAIEGLAFLSELQGVGLKDLPRVHQIIE